MKTYRHGFLGFGKMSQAILQSLLEHHLVLPHQVIVSRRSRAALKTAAKKFKVHTTTDNLTLASHCQYLWLGIKPFQATEVLQVIGPSLNSKTLILSMMAGVRTKRIQKSLGKKINITRLMPNTPLLMQEGMIGIYFPRNLSTAQKKQIEKLLSPLGETIRVAKESDLDAITGLSGSGPAFVYAMAQGMMKGGVKSGLRPAVAEKLTIQTLLGAAKMLKVSGQSPDQLIAQVVSKGGTTEAGLKILKQTRGADFLSKAVQKATQRARQIAKGS